MRANGTDATAAKSVCSEAPPPAAEPQQRQQRPASRAGDARPTSRAALRSSQGRRAPAEPHVAEADYADERVAVTDQPEGDRVMVCSQFAALLLDADATEPANGHTVGGEKEEAG